MQVNRVEKKTTSHRELWKLRRKLVMACAEKKLFFVPQGKLTGE